LDAAVPRTSERLAEEQQVGARIPAVAVVAVVREELGRRLPARVNPDDRDWPAAQVPRFSGT
jgi:hypothetical protein